VKNGDKPQTADQIFSRVFITDSEMIPAWIPASSITRRRDPQKDCARLRPRPHSSTLFGNIPALVFSASPSPLNLTRSNNPTMQSVPESRQQTFEEIYGPPENFLEIEVRYH